MNDSSAGHIVDQAALHGLLTKLPDLGLPLLSLTQVDADPQAPPRPPITASSAWHSTPQGD